MVKICKNILIPFVGLHDRRKLLEILIQLDEAFHITDHVGIAHLLLNIVEFQL